MGVDVVIGNYKYDIAALGIPYKREDIFLDKSLHNDELCLKKGNRILMCFEGEIGGFMKNSLNEILTSTANLAQFSDSLMSKLRDAIHMVGDPLYIRMYESPGCPHCAALVKKYFVIADKVLDVFVKVVNLSDAKNTYGYRITQVPFSIVLKDEKVSGNPIIGNMPEDILLNELINRYTK